jgi:DUF1680 family protein
MDNTRRSFLKTSATAASALTLGTLVGDAAGAEAAEAPQQAHDARVRAVESALVRARPVPLDKVRLTGGPLKVAQDATAVYLLSLDPDRMMAPYRRNAGLEPKGQQYGGWDADKHNLSGHIAGHHLSAVSLMFLATGDARFKERGDRLVAEMKEVQDKNGDGIVSGLDIIRQAFGELSKGEIRAQAFDLNGVWSPWYTLHKTYAGLRDAYRHLGNRTALDVEIKFAAWAEGVLKPLDDAQIQKMLLTEHGGMNEVLADLYADTGDKRWLDLSLKFEHRAFTDALKRHQDNLNGKHGNCQIPKLIGSAARFGYAGDPQDLIAASFFWDRVVQHHSYVTGGHGLEEYFGPPDQLSRRVDGRVAETCNVYNMLKLTRRLFSYRPDAFYADFHERALFNHILASCDPNEYATSYMVPVGRGVTQEYQNMQQSFTCCVGSGMESHALHGDGLYYESDDTVWVNLFAPSTAQLAIAGGAAIKMDSDFPDGDKATLTFTSVKTPKTFALAIRRPGWAGDGFAIKVDGQPVADIPTITSMRVGGAGGRNVGPDAPVPPSTYVSLKRVWAAGSTVEITLPKALRLEATPDDPRVAAIMWGPIVLAGDWGAQRSGRGRGAGAAGAGAPAPPSVAPVAMLVAAGRPIDEWVKPDAARAANFRTIAIGRVPSDPEKTWEVPLAPFYRTHRRTYSLYFDVVTPAEFTERVNGIAAESARLKKLEAATVAYIQPGDATREPQVNYQTDPANRQAPRTAGRTSRGGTGWFSYDLPVEPATAMALVVTYQHLQEPPTPSADFQILVDNTPIGTFEMNTKADGYYDTQYAIPAALVQGKTKVTVKFQATGASRITPVFGVRVIRAER